jgi:hypothetical protein
LVGKYLKRINIFTDGTTKAAGLSRIAGQAGLVILLILEVLLEHVLAESNNEVFYVKTVNSYHMRLKPRLVLTPFHGVATKI